MTTTTKTIRAALKVAGIRANSIRREGEWFCVEIASTLEVDISRAHAIASAASGIFFDRVSVTGPNGICGPEVCC
jgi:hypothetical protein